MTKGNTNQRLYWFLSATLAVQSNAQWSWQVANVFITAKKRKRHKRDRTMYSDLTDASLLWIFKMFLHLAHSLLGHQLALQHGDLVSANHAQKVPSSQTPLRRSFARSATANRISNVCALRICARSCLYLNSWREINDSAGHRRLLQPAACCALCPSQRQDIRTVEASAVKQLRSRALK